WPAVTHIAAPVREREHETPHFNSECIVLPIASPMKPQDQSRRAGSCERVQHRQNRGRTDPCAKQHDRALARLQDEASARCTDIERIAHAYMLPKVGSSYPIRLDLHADAVAL